MPINIPPAISPIITRPVSFIQFLSIANFTKKEIPKTNTAIPTLFKRFSPINFSRSGSCFKTVSKFLDCPFFSIIFSSFLIAKTVVARLVILFPGSGIGFTSSFGGVENYRVLAELFLHWLFFNNYAFCFNRLL